MGMKMGLATATASAATRPITLPPFHGVLALDSDRLSRVNSRFAGEVVEMGQPSPSKGELAFRVGDQVHAGDLLAVVWSKELGEKKSELVDALAKLRAEELLLKRLRHLYESGAGPERSVRDSERNVQAARVDVAKAERTLRTWRLTDADLKAIQAEADRIIALDRRPAPSPDWARVELRAPRDGVILEKNIAIGDLVDPTSTVFRIGDLSQLAVWAHVYEEDLMLLQALPQPIRWTVALPSRGGATFSGTLGKIGAVIDPAQHTALVSGRVENLRGDLKAGQFVTVTIELPAPTREVELPAAAVVEDGRESAVFVQPDPGVQRYQRRPVKVLRRFRDVIYVRAEETGVQPGDRVVTAGALLLLNAMDQLPPAGK